MKVIDLDVYGMIERSCVDGDCPFVVVTGESATMKKIVTQIVGTFGLHTKEKLGNSGRLVVCESR